MIKIIHVLTDTNIGGAGMWLLNFLRSFDREKYDVSVALPYDALLSERIKKLGITVHEVRYIADSSYSRKGTGELKELFVKIRPDIVHTHASLSARIAAKMLKIPVVNTRHCLEEPKKFPKNAIYSFVNNALSDIIIGVSQKTCENLIECGTKKSKVRLVYNGVFPLRKLSEAEKIFTKQKYGISEENTVIGMVARLEAVKNPFFLLDVAKLILAERRDVTFLIVGGGSLEGELQNKTVEMDISENVIFTGTLEDISEAVNIMDILTLTSEKEALSLSLIEGMTLGKPAVSTDSGGPSEVLYGGSGIITPQGNARAFADALLSYILYPEKAIEAGIIGRERAQKVFGIDKMNSSLDIIYNELLKKRHR